MVATEAPLPRKREKDLIVQEVAGETLVYDLKRHKAHCLNHTAALVWRHCDGATSESALAELLAREAGAPPDPDLVRLALSRLSSARLLDQVPSGEDAVSRRELVQRLKLVGVLSALVPAVTSIVAPTAAQAGSCVPCQGKCNTSADCCSQNGVPVSCAKGNKCGCIAT